MVAGEALTHRFGSPLYVYRLESVDEALRDLRAALPEPSTLHYSVKANPHPDVVGRLVSSGCRAEVSSSGELAAVIVGGGTASDCLYTGPGKSVEELSTAVEAGVVTFSCESLADLRRLGGVATALDVEVECLLRLNSAGAGAGGLRMTGRPSQFGIDVAGLGPAERLELTSVPGTRVTGLHFFPMSNARDEESLIASFRASIETAATLSLPLSRIDLGGGFPAPFAVPAPRFRFQHLRAALERLLDDHLPGWRRGSPEVIFESGRYLVGSCGSLICTTVELKSAAGVTFAILDSGINHLGGMAGLGRLARPAATPEHGEQCAVTTLAGPLCTPADILGRNVPVGELVPGRQVVFPNVGAYGLTASLMAFLSRPTPTEVVCDRDRVVSASQLNLVRTSIEVGSV